MRRCHCPRGSRGVSGCRLRRRKWQWSGQGRKSVGIRWICWRTVRLGRHDEHGRCQRRGSLRRRRIVRGRRRNRDRRLVRCRRNVGERRRGLWRCGGWRNGRLGWSRWERGGRGWRLGWRVRERRTGGLCWIVGRRRCSPDAELQPVLEVQTRRRVRGRSDRLRRRVMGKRGPAAFVQPALLHGVEVLRRLRLVQETLLRPVVLDGQERVARVPGRVRSGRDLRQRHEGRRAHRRLQRVFDRHHLRHQDRGQRRRRSTEQQVERANPAADGRSHLPGRALSKRVCRRHGSAARRLVRHLGHDADAGDELGFVQHRGDQDGGAEQPLRRRQRHIEDGHRRQRRQGGGHHLLPATDRGRQDGDVRPNHARHQQPLAMAPRPSHHVPGAVLPFRRHGNRRRIRDALRVSLVQLVGIAGLFPERRALPGSKARTFTRITRAGATA